MNSDLLALAGGALIGAASGLLLLVNGRIAGISGIAGTLIGGLDRDSAWRALFILGLLAGPVLYMALAGHWPEVQLDASWPMLVVGGLLVGFGTRLGSGCTSGHGICGISRLSPCSVAATALFMLAGFATVFVARHLIGYRHA